jgi:acyl-CoA synthetase (AMP-forming)/AMP-acid ligase II
LALPSGLSYLVAYLAAAKLGAITAGVNPRLEASERTVLARTATPDLVLATDDLVGGIPDHLEVDLVSSSDLASHVLADYREPGQRPDRLPANLDRPVCICFTSGSTGDPKGALFTNRQLEVIAKMDRGGAWGEGGHLIPGTALAHVGAMTKLGWQLAAGTTLHLLDRWRAGEVLDLVDRFRIPAITGVAAQVALMLDDPSFDDHDFDCVQAIVVGGGPSPPDLITAARRKFGAPYSNRYSSTESGGIGLATALDANDEEALHTVGRPRPGVDADVRDEEGQTVKPGEVGELWLRTPSSMVRYCHDPEATAATLIDGWLRTGDRALEDDQGCYQLAGRVDDMYIRGGYNVHPQEVEAVIGAHNGVDEVAVVPRPDPVMGQVGVAVVVPTDPERPPTLDDLVRISRAALAAYKVPVGLLLVDALPLNSAHKLDRRALTQVVAESPTTGPNDER